MDARIINALTKAGFTEIDGVVSHPEFGIFPSWEDAAVACIDVATGV